MAASCPPRPVLTDIMDQRSSERQIQTNWACLAILRRATAARNKTFYHPTLTASLLLLPDTFNVSLRAHVFSVLLPSSKQVWARRGLSAWARMCLGPEDTTERGREREFALEPDSTNKPLTRIPASIPGGSTHRKLLVDFSISRSR